MDTIRECWPKLTPVQRVRLFVLVLFHVVKNRTTVYLSLHRNDYDKY